MFRHNDISDEALEGYYQKVFNSTPPPKEQEKQEKIIESAKSLGWWGRIQTWAAAVFNVCKKLLDPFDDFWPAIRQMLPATAFFKATGFVLTGALGFINGSYEGIKGIIRLKRVYQSPIQQRKTRVTTGILTVVFGAAALGMGMSLFAAVFGASVIGTAFLTFLVPSVVATIFGITLWKNIYIWQAAKKEEQKKRDEYQQIIEAYKIVCEETPDSPNKQEHDTKILKVGGEWIFLKDKRLTKEAKVAFKAIETLTMVIVATGVMLSVASLIGLTAASLGILPVAVILVGATGAFLGKFFEEVDGHYHHQYTRKIRNFFVKKMEKMREKIHELFSHEKSPTPVALSVKEDQPPTSGVGGSTGWLLARQGVAAGEPPRDDKGVGVPFSRGQGGVPTSPPGSSLRQRASSGVPQASSRARPSL
ncbi:MAG TPA: hypothetical protein VJN02_00750 [Gammaproteobacteria bacterium]|nr:hypothetical protein [Gammaproteobacteria bacterium]